MTQKLTTEQLTQIIAEVGNLQASREAEIAPEEVKQILQELGLAPELLDEALVQMQRREVLKVRQKRHRTVAIGIFAAVAIAITGTIFTIKQHNSTLERVSTQSNRITLTQDDGADLRNITRQNNPEIFYRVTLKDTPVGQKLDLRCNWINPNGEIVKQNRYQTREIDTSIWNTQCRYTIGSASTPGRWKVEMFLQGRQLSETEFEVK
ncbi:DUF3859 domain-containing protein [Nodularia harveyana UHCC-0300]|uniref:DUF3859 domain-containing protein n=1 Tax=Nodularia harveyana UHCC-0300 TaxID=2974287 RepID=A0ABU5UBY3_9CYAN|nr:DUF3859 domain-containing protein [Nodularia harveyana]MEA5581035.1 DUF3859 domain-containing protein [Nodularia harveyana UHCC-0300]